MSIQSAFQKLLGRDPHPDELSDLYRMKGALQIGEDDTLWLIIIVLRHYETLYRGIPTEINATIDRLAAEIDRLNGVELNGVMVSSRPAPVAAISPPARWSAGRLAAVVAAGAVVFVAGVLAGGFGASRPLPGMSEQALSNCFNGAGRVEDRGGARYCFPVSADGKVLGYRLQ